MIFTEECLIDWPTVYFQFDGVWLEVQPQEYVFDVSERQDLTLCTTLWIMGSSDM